MLFSLYTYDQILSMCLNIIHENSYTEHAYGTSVS
jgi:hypothetical protein